MSEMKVLWPTDFSKNAESALFYVTSLSEKYQAEVHVLYVIDELGYHEPWYGDFDKARIDKIHDWERQRAKEKLDQICNNHLQGCPRYIKHIAIGDPAREILKLVQEEDVDMVVMATHGRRDSFQFGGVAEKVVKNSSVPVVTIPIKREP
jgi:nucleotide-binding universal stress UspA family protein